MSILETMRSWLAECPYLDEFSGGHIDWTDSNAMDYGIMPTGSVTIRMEEDVLGGKTVYKQYNMALYARGWTVDDVVRLENSTFLEDFADWVEEQQMAGKTPKFGDNPEEEEITAQNGMLYQMDPNGQTGLYQIQISVTYEKHYERS